jgi:hypothetical protein
MCSVRLLSFIKTRTGYRGSHVTTEHRPLMYQRGAHDRLIDSLRSGRLMARILGSGDRGCSSEGVLLVTEMFEEVFRSL